MVAKVVPLVRVSPREAKVLAARLREVELARTFSRLTGIPVGKLLKN